MNLGIQTWSLFLRNLSGFSFTQEPEVQIPKLRNHEDVAKRMCASPEAKIRKAGSRQGNGRKRMPASPDEYVSKESGGLQRKVSEFGVGLHRPRAQGLQDPQPSSDSSISGLGDQFNRRRQCIPSCSRSRNPTAFAPKTPFCLVISCPARPSRSPAVGVAFNQALVLKRIQ